METLRPRRRLLLALGALAGAIAVGAGVTLAVLDGDGGSSVDRATSAAAPAALVAGALDVSGIYERTAQGVVEIDVSAGGGGQAQGTGSGFVIDREGHVVTNEHVVDGAESISVLFRDGTRADATLVGSDPGTDVAVLKVEASAAKLAPLRLADSAGVKPGQAVVAIGSPFGLEGSITSGIVSAVGRTIRAPDGSSIAGAIQTDAAINKGNSGGPLLDAAGRVIGVNAQIESDTGGNDGVGFAIPISTARSIASRLIADGSVEHAYLGVQVETLTAAEAAQLGIQGGVRLAAVGSGAPAATAGLEDGDVVVSVDGGSVASAEALQAVIAAHAPGDRVELKVLRDGKPRTATATLGTRPS